MPNCKVNKTTNVTYNNRKNRTTGNVKVNSEAANNVTMPTNKSTTFATINNNKSTYNEPPTAGTITLTNEHQPTNKNKGNRGNETNQTKKNNVNKIQIQT